MIDSSNNTIKIVYSYKNAPTLLKFADCNAFMRAIVGPIGSGKSSACVAEIMKRAAEQKPGPDGVRRTRWVVIRQTYPQLRDTTIKTFMQWVKPEHFGEYKASDNTYLINAIPNTEIEVLFRALDRPDHISNLLSMELTGGWVNESKDVAWPVIDALQGRVGRYPAKRDGGPSWFGVFSDTNPADVDSKFYKFWEQTKHPPSFAQIFKQPSGLSKQAENLHNLPDDYYKTISQGKDPEWIKVFVHGEYGFVMDGQLVFHEYHDSVHCAEVKHISYAPIYRGWDFGLTPCVVLAQQLPSGQLIVFDELVSESMGIDQFSEEVISHCSQHYQDMEWIDVGDPAGEQRAQTDERTCFNILHSKGIQIEGGLNSVAIRLESVRKPLTRLTLGKPGFQLHPRCKVLRKGFLGGYHYRRLQTSVEKYTSVPDKNMYSHPHDSLQYLCSRIFGGGLTTYSPPGFESPRDDRFQDHTRSDLTGY